MTSARGFWASIVFIAALPLAVVSQALFGIEAETVFHFELAAGCLLLSPSAFNAPNWIKLTGSISTALLGITFALQGIAQIFNDTLLTWLAFGVLGQWFESFLIDLLLIWLLGVLFTRPAGMLKVIGFIFVIPAASMLISSYALPFLGSSLEEQPAAVKLLLLMPFIWLMLESYRSKPA